MQVFSKEATKTDVNVRFSVPVTALRFFPNFGEGHTVDIPVRDKTGHVYAMHCYIRREGHPKPVFSAGWREFIRRKDVKVGGMIIFRFKQDDATGVHYKIEANQIAWF